MKLHILLIYIFIVINYMVNVNYISDNILKNKMELIELSNDIMIYSLFFYKKENNIILIGYSKHNIINKSNLKCIIIYKSAVYSLCHLSYNIYKIINNHFLIINILANIKFSCSKILINNKVIQPYIIKYHRLKYACTLCITKFINYSAYTYLLEAINSYKLSGIDHIVIYYISSSKKVYKILKYYEGDGLIDIIRWNYKYETEFLRNDIYGQIWKYNDCLYRYKIISKAIIFNDLDEILWTNDNRTIQEIIKQENLIYYDVLFLHNRIFRKEFFSNENYSNSRIVPYDRYNHDIPDFSMFSYHNSCIYKKGYLSKYIIVNSSKIQYIGIHDVLICKDVLKKKYINSNITFLRHTRRVREDLLNDCKLWKDYYSNKEKKIKNIVKKIKTTLF